MSARGRGNVTIKRGTFPNLALAGKREDSSASTSKGDRGKKTRGQGGRGRGQRGGRGGFAKPGLIVSEGIFSDGLTVEGAKKKRETETNISFAKNSRNGTEKKVTVQAEASKASFAGWDAEWQSDEEEDQAHLEVLIGGDTFVSDLKKGDRLPIVLPTQDETQFDRIMNKQPKMEVYTEEFEDEKIVRKEAPFSRLSRKAGHIISQVLDDPDDSLMFMQLPSVVNVLTGTAVKEEMMVDEQMGRPAESKPFSLPDLPRGKKIGKLLVMNSGRVVLRVGDLSMDVTAGAPADLRESVVMLETTEEGTNRGGILGSREGRNSVYHMGSIRHHLMASLPWTDIPAIDKKEPISPTKPSKKAVCVADRALLTELASLEEESSQWAVLADRWARP